jgi:hypothetical protein
VYFQKIRKGSQKMASSMRLTGKKYQYITVRITSITCTANFSSFLLSISTPLRLQKKVSSNDTTSLESTDLTLKSSAKSLFSFCSNSYCYLSNSSPTSAFTVARNRYESHGKPMGIF